MAKRGDEQDLLAVRDFIHLCGQIQQTLRTSVEHDLPENEANRAKELADKFMPLPELARNLEDAIDESVMEKRRALQEATADDLESAVIQDELKQTREEYGEVKVRQSSRSKAKSVDADESPFWGPALEHLIRPG